MDRLANTHPGDEVICNGWWMSSLNLQNPFDDLD